MQQNTIQQYKRITYYYYILNDIVILTDTVFSEWTYVFIILHIWTDFLSYTAAI